MKIGLFLALLVLLASTNVFGQDSDTNTESTTRLPSSNTNDVDDQAKFDRDNLNRPDVDTVQGQDDGKVTQTVKVTTTERKPAEVETDRKHRKTGKVTKTGREPVEVETDRKQTQTVEVVTSDRKPVEGEPDRKQTQTVKITTTERKPVEVEPDRKQTQTVEVVTNDRKPVEGEPDRKQTQTVEVVTNDRKPVEGEPDRKQTQTDEVVTNDRKPVEVEPDRKQTQTDQVVTNDRKPVEVEPDRKPTQTDKVVTNDRKPVEVEPDRKPTQTDKVVTNDRKPVEVKTDGPSGEFRPDGAVVVDEATSNLSPVVMQPNAEVVQGSENSVHISGNIVMLKYRSSVIDTVQYDLDGALLVDGVRPAIQFPQIFSQELIAKDSLITLYVATSKTFDRKLAFAKYPITFNRSYFPISFDINVELPNQQRGLLNRADITLYFFVYIYNVETHMDTFIPAGTSQILLQGTNQLVQKLDIYVKASGIEVSGLFRGRFGERYIPSGTAFQVFIISDESLTTYSGSSSFESVAQLTINNVPAMYPVPFSILVQNQSLKPNMKYYAVAFYFQNGIRHLIHQRPIWVINEQKAIVTSQVIFNIAPLPFILRGSVARATPGIYSIQVNSTLVLRIREVGTETGGILFKLPGISQLPQVFRIYVSESPLFDPSKNYDIMAFITDENNDVYMASLQSLPLLDEVSSLVIPVDDLVYNVQARLHASSNQQLSYIPGSKAVILVTDSPELPTEPIANSTIDSIPSDFHEFSIKIPATSIKRGRNYYLEMIIVIRGVITHVSKILLISNDQPPPFLVQLPVLSHNLIRGFIYDVDNRLSQWSSSSYANLYLLDDRAENPDKAIVQVWKIHLENDFPLRFEVQLDFSRILPHHMYRLQAAIENGRSLLEYKPAGSVLVLNSNGHIMSDVRVPVHNVKTSQLVKGLLYISGLHGPLPEKALIIVQLSSSPLLTNPSIIDEIRIKVDGRSLPVEFSMNLPLNKIDVKAIYYFLVQYVVGDNIVIPVSQAFAFSPLNDATVVLTISKTPQIPITGQVTSTGSPLSLPSGATLHLYITDSIDSIKSLAISEVFLQASPNSLYQFTMNIDSLILQKKIPLYLHADILYQGSIILSIPRPALLQITPGGEWNINLVIDLPTLLVGKIISLSQHELITGEVEVYIQIFQNDSTPILHTSQIRLDAALPQAYRIELDTELFVQYPSLKARAIIKNCKEQILFESGGSFDIHAGLNVNVDLTVVLSNPQKLKELHTNVNEIASVYIGLWQLSVAATNTDKEIGAIASFDSDSTSEKEKPRLHMI